jgi:16S rRNA (cytosine1402-N4)-methyltransferase
VLEDPDSGPSGNLEEAFGHLPVLPKECLEALDIKPDGFYVDATMGGGGHSRLILEALGENGRLLALDADPDAVSWARSRWIPELTKGEGGGVKSGEERIIVRNANFRELTEILKEEGLGQADGILADLGVSGRQLKDPERGFSFAEDGPLDMRMSADLEVSAADLVNRLPEKDLANLIFELGEERHSRRIARAIVEVRRKKPFTRTRELADLAYRVLRGGGKERIHPATRLFMALRIKVNDELGALRDFLRDAHGNIKEGGRLAVISFHSLEDREVKELFRRGPLYETAYWEALWKKPLTPGPEEAMRNPRARSAKLRAAVRL